MCQQDTKAAKSCTSINRKKTWKQILKQWLFIQVKLTEFTFKTVNKRGCNTVIRKRVPNIDDPIGKEVTISSGEKHVMLT